MAAIFGRIIAGNVAKKVAAKETQQIALVTAEKSATRFAFSNVASVAAKTGGALAVGNLAYNGVQSLGNGLSNITSSSLAGVGGALDNLESVGGSTLSALGDSVGGGVDSVLLLGGAAVIALFFLMPKKK